MPRRHRAARDRARPELLQGPGWLAPRWAQVEGFIVREITNQKTYVCPGCNGQVPAGIPHLVVMDEYDEEDRRHWHTSCWRREVKTLE